MTNKSIKIFLNYLIGPILFIWLTYNVVHQIYMQPDLNFYLQKISEIIQEQGILLMLVVITLMFFQWGVEAKKWQILIRPIHKVSIGESIRAIFSGIAFSIATPNRIGEFAGRILHLPEGTRLQGTSLTFVGNFAQLIVTLICGSISLFFLSAGMQDIFSQQIISGIELMFKIFIPFTAFFSLIVYFKMGFVFDKLFSLKIFNRLNQKLFVLKQIPFVSLFHVLVLSFLRFFIFIIQYILLFYITGVSVGITDSFLGISFMFLLLAIVPTISFLELGLRWQFALVIFGVLSDNKLGISISITAIWLLNLMLPAILGAISVFNFNRLKD